MKTVETDEGGLCCLGTWPLKWSNRIKRRLKKG